MTDIIEGINPTRMELLKLKKKKKLADKGHRLLKDKRDALIVEFFGIVEKSREIAEQAAAQLNNSREDLTLANAMLGTTELQSIALAGKPTVELEMSMRNVMGVHVPELTVHEIEKTLDHESYSLMFTSSVVDRTVSGFEESLKLVIRLSEIEASLRTLSAEIEKTKRRVNALEYIVIPKLDNTKKYIEMRLSELERENFSRLKAVKRKRERMEAEADKIAS